MYAYAYMFIYFISMAVHAKIQTIESRTKIDQMSFATRPPCGTPGGLPSGPC